ncbi:MAG: type II toxin-antitoxin system PemK/MazF family toxin [Demequinaceae bacterium]|nr:type II toxin-antitoxin system PemK/MazF family toxin [Demequinaceae bacterium]
MLRGDIRWADPGPATPGEAAWRRPAVVVSNNGANAASVRSGRGVVTVIPLTSHTATLHPFQVLLPAEECGLAETSKAQTEQIRALSVTKIGPRVGTVPPHLMREIDEALRTHLAL